MALPKASGGDERNWNPSWRLCFCQRLRLDQQTLSFVTAARPAEAHDDSMSGAFRLDAPRKQGIARRQIFEIIETSAAR
jgi:hypothetical protein